MGKSYVFCFLTHSVYPHKRRQESLKTESRIKGEIGSVHSLQSTYVWKWLVVKITGLQTYQKAKNLYTIYFAFDLDGEC